MDLEPLVRPVVESAGLELVDATYRRETGRRILRVTVDREGGVDLDTIAEVSSALSRHLEGEPSLRERYSLEVSSPGVERPLRRPEDFAKRVGEKVKVKTVEPLDGSRVHTGTIVSADEDRVVLATETGERGIGFGDMAAARTVFEWGKR